MKATLLGLLFGITCVSTLSTSLLAHHGSASFDPDTELTMKGTVTQWLWANPHCFLKVDIMDESGAVRTWNLEMGNPTDITSRGFGRRTFRPGDEVTVIVQPVRGGAPVGRLRGVILPDGRKL